MTGVGSVPCNAAGVVAFREGRVALVHIERQGVWDIVFGHVETGETPEEAARREAYEEGGIILGHDLRTVLTFEDKNGFNVAFAGDVEQLVPLPSGHETSEVRFFSPSEAIELAGQYMSVNRTIILRALEAMTAAQ